MKVNLERHINRILKENQRALKLQLKTARLESAIGHSHLAENTRRIEALEKQNANMAGRLWALGIGLSAFWALIAAGVGLVVHLLGG